MWRRLGDGSGSKDDLEFSPDFSSGIHKEVQSSTGCSQRRRDLPLSGGRRSGKVFDIKREKF
jgi:hypothetical protein